MWHAWGMPKRSSKTPAKDINQLAASIVGQAISEDVERPQLLPNGRNAAAVALGRLGGLKGGKARAANLSARKRRQIAVKAAMTRWNKSK